MVLKAFSVRDSKGEMYYPPFYKNTMGEAERTFHQMTKEEKSPVSQYPEDFDLYYLGEWDDNAGRFDSLPAPQHVVKAVNLVSR